MTEIAIIVENSRAYGRMLIEGIADYAQKNCAWLLRQVSADEISSVNLRKFDGIIARIADDRLAERITASGRPAVDVFCQRSRVGLAGVDADNRRIGIMARDFFRARGFGNFAYCGFPGTAFSDARERAYSDASTHVYSPGRRRSSETLPFYSDETKFYDERFDRIADARSLAHWVRTLPLPVAVFCCNDLRAIQLQRVATDNGLRVPQDLAILGVDNDTIACSFARIPISSINPNSFEVGRAAARILAATLAEPPVRRLHKIYRVRPGGITERSSTEFMPIDPPWLGQMLLHIEKNMSRPIPASELFALFGLSSTHVEGVFRKKLGMTVQSYITSVKMREARRLLSRPNLRISEIGYLCGFTSPQYFCRTFTSTFGSSPRAYRKAGGQGPTNDSNSRCVFLPH